MLWFVCGIPYAPLPGPCRSAYLHAHTHTYTHTHRHFRRLRDSYPSASKPVASTSATALAQRPERPILEMCLATAAVGLGMVMAGSGDLGAFRLLRELRWRVDAEVRAWMDGVGDARMWGCS